MVTPMFLKKGQLQEYLGIPANKAISLLAEHGVHPIDLGKGPGNGLRWRTSAVKLAMDALHAESQPRPKTSPRHPKMPQHCLVGRTVNEVHADLSRDKNKPLH